jgi:hypothetical protein
MIFKLGRQKEKKRAHLANIACRMEENLNVNFEVWKFWFGSGTACG